ncbi:MAG: cytidylyltransferase domain-containing protein [Bacillota bacterium]
MIKDKTVLAIIPARGGSKGVPLKNIRDVGGKPLIAWTIMEGKKSKYIDRLILSSEDERIINVAKKLGCEVPFTRPSSLAQDETPSIDVIVHAVQTIPEKYDYIVLLQPTSPLRKVTDIDNCIEQCLQKNAKACVSVTEPEKSPFWMYKINENGYMIPLVNLNKRTTRRQDLPTVYALNGAVYVAQCKWLLEARSFLTSDTIPYFMPRDRSFDIDSEIDLIICDFLLNNPLSTSV